MALRIPLAEQASVPARPQTPPVGRGFPGTRPEQVAVVRQTPGYEPGAVGESVDRALGHLGLRWTDLACPGERVLLKPNLIREAHSHRPGQWEQIITHGTVIAAVARGVASALRGRGRITIADAPQTDSDFARIRERVGLDALSRELQREYPALDVRVADLRREEWVTRNGVVVERRPLPGDPDGYTLVNLGGHSNFHSKKGRLYGADYDTGFTARHHADGTHEYLLSRSAMDADVFINLPKLKTHKKVGVTISLKNLVGINGDKNYLPHFSMGTPDEDGDEFPSSTPYLKLQSRFIRLFKRVARRTNLGTRAWGPVVRGIGSRIFGPTERVVRSGNWHGNDTAWRMVLDLNEALFYFDGNGAPRTKPLRYLSIVDGIVAGDGCGPMEADPKPCGVLLAGTNPVAVDLVGSSLMGFDWRRIPMIREAFQVSGLPLADFRAEEVSAVPDLGPTFRFEAHFGWKGHVEAD